jgi:hypothetical protein
MLLNNVIREALKDSDPAYDVARSDEIDDPGMITDRMIHDILNADLVIADLTFLKPNAFYELGIRHAREKPVIHFASSETNLPFDAMTHRAVIQDITSWEGLERARQQIRAQAKATEAEDYRVSNPITQANASFQMRESADPKEKLLAEVLARLERLERHRNANVDAGLAELEEQAFARGDVNSALEFQAQRRQRQMTRALVDALRATPKASHAGPR